MSKYIKLKIIKTVYLVQVYNSNLIIIIYKDNY